MRTRWLAFVGVCLLGCVNVNSGGPGGTGSGGGGGSGGTGPRPDNQSGDETGGSQAGHVGSGGSKSGGRGGTNSGGQGGPSNSGGQGGPGDETGGSGGQRHVFGEGCNAIVPGPHLVSVNNHPPGTASPVGPRGGPIESGTYVVSARDHYTTVAGCQDTTMPFSQTVIIAATSSSAGSAQYAVWMGDLEAHLNLDYTTSGTRYTGKATCPAQGEAATTEYTATPTQLILFEPNPVCPGTLVEVLTRQ